MKCLIYKALYFTDTLTPSCMMDITKPWVPRSLYPDRWKAYSPETGTCSNHVNTVLNHVNS